MTSIEWLLNYMTKNNYFIGNDLLQAFEKAEEMHKQEILAASNGYTTTELLGVTKGEYYYQETFKKD